VCFGQGISAAAFEEAAGRDDFRGHVYDVIEIDILVMCALPEPDIVASWPFVHCYGLV
jgi:hypothetical protein